MEKYSEKYAFFILAIGLTFIFLVSLSNAWNDSAIFDETAHIGAAYSYVSQQEIRLNPEHPPLIKDLAGLPLLFLDLKFDVNQPFWDGSLPNKWDAGQWQAGRHLLYEAGNNPNLILFYSRLPIVFLALFLGLFLFYWGKELGGILVGLTAFILYAFDPNMLGHNHFVTTDLGISLAFTLTFYFYLKFIKNPAWKNVILAGIFLGILEVTKFSFFVAFPIMFLVTLIYPLVAKDQENSNLSQPRWKKLFAYFGKGLLIFLISIVVVWIVYFFNTLHMSPETVSQVIDANFSPFQTDSDLNIRVNNFLHQIKSNPFTRPLVEWFIGLAYVFRRVAGGNGAYFLGQVSNQAFPFYFPIVFLIKETLPFLSALSVAAFFGFTTAAKAIFHNESWREKMKKFRNFLRLHIVEWSLLLFIAVYLYISLTGNLNIGLRHLFPIFPFIYLLVAQALNNFLKSTLEVSRKSLLIIFFFFTAWIVWEAVTTFPAYMSYFNQTVGGPKKGYLYVTDSNADWGQDLKRLAIFLNKHPEIEKINTDYFGGGDARLYLGEKYSPWWDSKRPVEPGWYAISVNFLQGSLYDKTKRDSESYRWLRGISPEYQIGTSILIYKIEEKQALQAR